MRENNRRKLIPAYILITVEERINLGVPVARIIKDLQINVSNPHLKKLVKYYLLYQEGNLHYNTKVQIRDSLFPPWLDNRNTTTLQPEGWKYSGMFPFGIWEQVE